MTETPFPNLGPERAKNDVPRERPCLRCGVSFWSNGFGERVCRSCKSKKEWRNGDSVSHGFHRRG